MVVTAGLCQKPPNVTKIIVGKPLRSRWKMVVQFRLLDDLVRGSSDIDIIDDGGGSVTLVKGFTSSDQ